MKNLIITIAIIFGIVTSANSQSLNRNESFIRKFSLDVGLGAEIPTQGWPYLNKSKSTLLGNLGIQYQINKNISVKLNTAFVENSGFEISYSTIGAKYSYLNYENTLLPYFGLDMGAYFYKQYYVSTAPLENWQVYKDEGRKASFGGSIGTGLDLKMSNHTTFDINVKLHSFELAKSNSTYFITVLTALRINF